MQYTTKKGLKLYKSEIGRVKAAAVVLKEVHRMTTDEILKDVCAHVVDNIGVILALVQPKVLERKEVG